MDSGTRGFWIVLVLLLGASLYFWSGVQDLRARQQATPVEAR